MKLWEHQELAINMARQLIGHKVKQGYCVGSLEGVMVMYNPSEVTEIKKPLRN